MINGNDIRAYAIKEDRYSDDQLRSEPKLIVIDSPFTQKLVATTKDRDSPHYMRSFIENQNTFHFIRDALNRDPMDAESCKLAKEAISLSGNEEKFRRQLFDDSDYEPLGSSTESSDGYNTKIDDGNIDPAEALLELLADSAH